MSESAQPTIVEYARFHGLIKDHRSLDPIALLPSSKSWPASLEEPDEGIKIESLHASLANEKLAISKEALKLLSSCAAAPSIGVWDSEDFVGPRGHAYKQKLEIPILLTEHELDVQRFGQRFEPDLAGLNLPYERIDEEQDEGFTWPDGYHATHQDLNSRGTGEKIEATRDVLLHLQNALKDSYTDEDEKALFEIELRHKRVSL